MTPAEVTEAADLLSKIKLLGTVEAQIQAGGVGADALARIVDMASIVRTIPMSSQAASALADAFQSSLLAHVNRQRTAWANRLAHLGVVRSGGAP